MNRLLLRSAATAALVLMTASMAHAQAALNMAWTDCVGDATPVTNMAFACNTNAGGVNAHTLVLSFIAPAGIDSLNGAEMWVDIISQSTPLPAWWNAQSGGCRAGAIGVNFAYGGAGTCIDSYTGAGVGGVAGWNVPVSWLPTINGSNSAQYTVLDFAAAVPQGSELACVQGSEYFVGNVSILNTKTTGTGLCAGCTDPVCLSFTRCLLTQPAPAIPIYISTPGTNSLVTWQGVGADCAAVPVRKATWGAIKSMYR